MLVKRQWDRFITSVYGIMAPLKDSRMGLRLLRALVLITTSWAFVYENSSLIADFTPWGVNFHPNANHLYSVEQRLYFLSHWPTST